MLQYLSCTICTVSSTVKGKECLGKHSTFWQALPDIEKTSHNMLMCNVAFTLIINSNQSICSTLDWVLKSQADFDWVLCKHHWEFQIHKRIIQMLTCPWLAIFHLSKCSASKSGRVMELAIRQHYIDNPIWFRHWAPYRIFAHEFYIHLSTL